MKRFFVYSTLFFLLVLTVPWFFVEPRNESLFGLPPWAFYSLAASLVYAVVVCFCLEKLWALSDSDEKDLTDAG